MFAAIASGRRRNQVSVPTNQVLPKFVDPDGNVATSPIPGEVMEFDLGGWSAGDTFQAQVYAETDGALEQQTFSPFTPLEPQLGQRLRLGVKARVGSGAWSAEAFSAWTDALAMPEFAGPPSLVRTTTSGTLPMGANIGYPDGTREGMTARIIVTNSSTNEQVQNVTKIIGSEDLTGPTPISDWSGAQPVPLAPINVGEEATAEVFYISPAGTLVSSGFSTPPITPTTVTLGPEMLAPFANAGWVFGNNTSLNGDGTLDAGFCSDIGRFPVAYEEGAIYRAVLVIDKSGQEGGALRFDQGPVGGSDQIYEENPLPDGARTINFQFPGASAAGWFNFNASRAFFVGTIISASLKKVIS